MLDSALEKRLPRQMKAVPLRPLADDISFRQTLSKELMWRFRITLACALLNDDVAVLITDLNVIWIHDPVANIFDKLPPKTDIATLRAHTDHPVRAWGTVAGYSFIYFKPTNATRIFLGAVKRKWFPDPEPNSTNSSAPANWINHALKHWGTMWPGEGESMYVWPVRERECMSGLVRDRVCMYAYTGEGEYVCML